MTIDDLLRKWLGAEGGAERANYQMFLTELSQALRVEAPHPKGAGLGEYQFEAPVRSEAALGTKGTGRIDLYKRDCFILEAKQSQLKPGEIAAPEPAAPPPEPIKDLFGNLIGYEAPKGTATPRYDRLMADARIQAEKYALALPGAHKAPPFLIVADIGRSFELYFDWSGQGRGYGPFPNERGYRIGLADLADPKPLPGVGLSAADILRAIWTEPASIDPRLRAAEVTRDIAKLLSKVATRLEQDQRALRPGDAEIALGIEATSLFLMRLLFCMFAEDVELLPKDSFKRFLADAKDRSDQYWRSGLKDLWSAMNHPRESERYWSFGDALVRYFNGNLFSGAQVFDLPGEEKGYLLIAAQQDWRAVEPAIFGTLLEQVLTAADRAKLGAHYTPRAYVERLVQATILDVLRPEWERTLEKARALLSPSPSGEGTGVGPVSGTALSGLPHPNPSPEGEGLKEAIALACTFHARLVAIRVLDPACGTGNFLYVAMEQLLRLESEVRQFVVGLGGTLAPQVHPNQFLGLELNPRAAVIAELVLWIGWLRYRLANTPEAIGEPVLPPLTNINHGTHGGYDAVLVRTATGEPDTANPRRPDWPAADFIIGNPPFIGKGERLRDALGEEYIQALWAANPNVPKSADFVMHWWDRAADLLTRPETRLRRFGFVTTNSITQVFSRRVIERYLHGPSPLAGEGDSQPQAASGVRGKRGADGDSPSPSHAPAARGPLPLPQGERGSKLHLTLAIPDHPWTRVTRDAAAVRIAMTVAAAGPGTGALVRITGERGLDTDAPELDEDAQTGVVHADLSIGTDVTRVVPLRANNGLSSNGMLLAGRGFVLSRREAEQLIALDGAEARAIIKPYRGGSELVRVPQDRFIIDLSGYSEAQARQQFASVYQHLLKTVREARAKVAAGSSTADAKDYLSRWWQFAKQRPGLRQAVSGLNRYIATTETTKHRIFQFVPGDLIPDHMIIGVASDESFVLGVLSSTLHTSWVLETGGWLGVGNDSRYSKSKVFDPFPFPVASPEQRPLIEELGEEIDQTRRTALADNPSLTMTGLYNLVAAVRDGTLAPADEAKAVKARARIVAKLHDDLDAAVAAAYGWEWPLPPAEIVARLVALNAERAAEERAGQVRWLRPDYQIPRFGTQTKDSGA